MARRLESQGDNTGALAALERAASADPRAAEVKAEIASFQLRRSKRDEAEKAAREAIALDDENTEAHKVLGLIYAATADTFNGRAQAAQFAASAKEAIAHLERAIGDLSGASDINLHYTLGRLYMRMGDNAKAIAALTRVVDQNPGSVQGRLSLAQAYAAADDLQGAIDARHHRRRGAARGVDAGAVPRAGGTDEGGGRHLHQGARGAADEPRAQGPPQ